VGSTPTVSTRTEIRALCEHPNAELSRESQRSAVLGQGSPQRFDPVPGVVFAPDVHFLVPQHLYGHDFHACEVCEARAGSLATRCPASIATARLAGGGRSSCRSQVMAGFSGSADAGRGRGAACLGRLIFGDAPVLDSRPGGLVAIVPVDAWRGRRTPHACLRISRRWRGFAGGAPAARCLVLAPRPKLCRVGGLTVGRSCVTLRGGSVLHREGYRQT
jgi:hypothetical protein